MTTSENRSDSLFRSEVLTATRDQWLGAVRLAQPASALMVAVVAVLIALGFLAFVCVGSVTKKAHVIGILTPAQGSLSISAASAGILQRQHVREGQYVRAGQALFELSTERQGTAGELTTLIAQQLASRAHSLEAERRLRTVQQGERSAALEERLRSLDAEIAQMAQEVELATRRMALAQNSLRKFETLEQSGFVSSAQTQQKQEDLIDLSGRLSSLARSQVQLQASRQQIRSELDSLATSLASDLAQIERAKALLGQEMAENRNRKSFLVTAPQNGTLTTITYRPGQAVDGGQVLATLIPEQASRANAAPELEVQLYAPSRSAGFVAPGQSVLLRYQAFPYQKFGLQKGVVTDVSRTPFAPGELPQHLASTILSNAQQYTLGANTSEALYRIRVRLERQSIEVYGRAQPLKPGMTLEADILQDSRKIWEWIAEPLLAIRR